MTIDEVLKENVALKSENAKLKIENQKLSEYAADLSADIVMFNCNGFSEASSADSSYDGEDCDL